MITLTDNAVEKVHHFLEDEDNKGKALRIFVEGGGCSGFQYGLAFDNPVEDDATLKFGDVTVVIDPASATLIKGAQVDFVDTVQGSGFKVTNPNAKSTCGCGQSFSA